jgi:hypothetical protein
MHEVGSTNFMYTTNPTFARIDASDVARRLKHLLPSDGDGGFFPDDNPNSEGTVTFPVLQPVSLPRPGAIPIVDPWSDSPGAVVFEVNFQDTISLLPGSMYVLGEVVVPLAKLTQHGEISGWFQVLEAGSTRFVALGAAGLDSSDTPQIYFRAAWTPPSSHSGGYNDTEREASVVIQEEMARSAVASKETKLGLVGSSMGAINTVRGLSDNLLLVQNALGLILDAIGSFRNAFNFTVRFSTSTPTKHLQRSYIFFRSGSFQVERRILGCRAFVAALDSDSNAPRVAVGRSCKCFDAPVVDHLQERTHKLLLFADQSDSVHSDVHFKIWLPTQTNE